MSVPSSCAGIGDLVVGGAAATARLRLGLRTRPVAIAMGAGLPGALAYGRRRGGAPAIPFIAVAVAPLVRRHQARMREIRRDEPPGARIA